MRKKRARQKFLFFLWLTLSPFQGTARDPCSARRHRSRLVLVAVEAALRRFKKKNDRKEREKGADFFFDFKVFGGVVLYNENEKSGKKKKKAKAFARYSSTFDFDKKVGVLSIRGGVFSFFFCRRARARLDCFLTKAGGK